MKNIIVQILIISIFFCSPLYASERSAVPGTKTTIIPPSEFILAHNFPGFILEEAGSSIMVTEMPGPLSKIADAFTEAGAATQGMSLISREKIQKRANSGLLLHLSQEAYGTQFLKWIYIFGTELNTTMVTATFPAELKQHLSEKMKSSILSSSLRIENQIDPFEGLTFMIEESSEFKIAKRVSNMLMITEGGVLDPKPTPNPIFIVGSSISQGLAINDKEAFSSQRVKAIKTMNNIQVSTSKPITINGLSGFEIIADSTHAKSKESLFVYQVTLFDETDYFIMLGYAQRNKIENYISDFKKMAYSFKKK